MQNSGSFGQRHFFIRLFGVLVSVARERKICGEEKGWLNTVILVIDKCNKEVLLAFSSLSDHMYKDFIFCFSLPKTREPGLPNEFCILLPLVGELNAH